MTASARIIFHDHPIDWLRALMAAMNVPLSSTEPDLQVPTTALSSVGEKFAPFARPWIVPERVAPYLSRRKDPAKNAE